MDDPALQIMAHDGGVLVSDGGSAAVVLTAEAARAAAVLLLAAANAAEAGRTRMLGAVVTEPASADPTPVPRMLRLAVA